MLLLLPSPVFSPFGSPRWKEIYVHYRLFLSDDVNFVAFLAFACSSAPPPLSPPSAVLWCGSHVLLTVAYQPKEIPAQVGPKKRKGGRAGKRWVQLALIINVVHCGAWCMVLVLLLLMALHGQRLICCAHALATLLPQKSKRTQPNECRMLPEIKRRALGHVAFPWLRTDYDRYQAGCKCRHKITSISGIRKAFNFGMLLYLKSEFGSHMCPLTNPIPILTADTILIALLLSQMHVIWFMPSFISGKSIHAVRWIHTNCLTRRKYWVTVILCIHPPLCFGFSLLPLLLVLLVTCCSVAACRLSRRLSTHKATCQTNDVS